MFRRTPEHANASPAELTVAMEDGALVISGPSLDAVLDEVGTRLGPDAEVIDAERSIVGGIAGFFGRERFTVTARSADPGASTVQAAPLPTGHSAFPAGHPAPAGRSLPESPAHDERPALDGPSFAAELARALGEVDDLVAAVRQQQTPGEPARDATPQAPVDLLADQIVAEPDVPQSELVRHRDAGALLALTAADRSDDELISQLSQLVVVPPSLPQRGVVAVVGEPADAVATAELLAEQAGLRPEDVLVAAASAPADRAAWLTVSDPEDAARRRVRWGSADRLTVVAVSLHPGLEGLHWARTMLGALDPDQVRLSVPGWRNVEEVAPRLQGLGTVDAIDLRDPVDPTAACGFLGLAVPVATIAGQPVDVDGWAALLRPELPAAVPAADGVVVGPDGSVRAVVAPHAELGS